MENQDKLKTIAALACICAGIAGYYVFSTSPMVLRALSVIAGVIAGAGIMFISAPGQQFVVYAQESWAEARKVVWPTQKETMQMTGAVFLFVVVLALFLWLIDSTLSWFFYDLLLGRV